MAGDDETEATAPEAKDGGGGSPTETADAPAADGPSDEAKPEEKGEGKATDGDQPEKFDADAAQGRLDEVQEKIEEARQALKDVEDDVTPEPDGPPIAEGDGAANAPPA